MAVVGLEGDVALALVLMLALALVVLAGGASCAWLRAERTSAASGWCARRWVYETELVTIHKRYSLVLKFSLLGNLVLQNSMHGCLKQPGWTK